MEIEAVEGDDIRGNGIVRTARNGQMLLAQGILNEHVLP